MFSVNCDDLPLPSVLVKDGFFFDDLDQLKEALSRALDAEDWEPTVDPLLDILSRADVYGHGCKILHEDI